MKTNKELPKGVVISEDIAKKELEKWFDFRKMKDKARKNIDDDLDRDVMADKMVEGFMYGLLILDDLGNLTQKLDFPVETENKSISIKELIWKPRFRESELNEPLKGVKANDSSGRMKAYMSAITSITKQKLGTLDYSDYSLSQTIVSYFLL
ncbi:hypothetical protein KAR91_68715 [Candidatus Pacearchaeota archaeon]|nr:hypothetical protein [Candidatus Pacearchaeota archaeon]